MNVIDNTEALNAGPASDACAAEFVAEKIAKAKEIAGARFRDVIMVLHSGQGTQKNGYMALVGGHRVERCSGVSLREFARANFASGMLVRMGRNYFIVMTKGAAMDQLDVYIMIEANQWVLHYPDEELRPQTHVMDCGLYEHPNEVRKRAAKWLDVGVRDISIRE